jgi:hypothetical protein
VIKSIINQESGTHVPSFVSKSASEEDQTSTGSVPKAATKSPSFLLPKKTLLKASSPEPVIRNYLSPLSVYQKEKGSQNESLMKLAASHA